MVAAGTEPGSSPVHDPQPDSREESQAMAPVQDPRPVTREGSPALTGQPGVVDWPTLRPPATTLLRARRALPRGEGTPPGGHAGRRGRGSRRGEPATVGGTGGPPGDPSSPPPGPPGAEPHPRSPRPRLTDAREGRVPHPAPRASSPPPARPVEGSAGGGTALPSAASRYPTRARRIR